MRIISKFVFLSGILFSSASVQEDDTDHPRSRQLLAETGGTKEALHRGFNFPSMKDRPMTKMFSESRRKKKRSLIPSSSLVFRHLTKKGHFKQMPSIAKNLFNSKTRQYSSKKGLFGRRLEPDWADDYQALIDAIVDLFLGMLEDAEWDSDVLISPSDYCSSTQQVAEPEACENAINSLLTLVENVVYHPWVVADMFFFAYINISMLPLEYIFDWGNLREFLHSIPKDFIYNDALLPLFGMFWQEFGQDMISDALPVLLETFYMEFEPSGLLDDGTADFVQLVSYYLTGDADSMSQEELDFVHSEVCYALTLEAVSMDIVGTIDADGFEASLTVTGVPHCVYPEYFDENLGEELFSMQSEHEDMYCTLTATMTDGDTIDDGDDIENPNALFYLRTRGGNHLTKECSWLKSRPDASRESICSKARAPDGYSLASEVCPSSCCSSEEKPDGIFLVGLKNGEPTVRDCEWLSGRPTGFRRKKCKMTDTVEDILMPAYAVCPETCGLCSGGEIV